MLYGMLVGGGNPAPHSVLLEHLDLVMFADYDVHAYN